jgi:hypothetical protein
MFEADNIRDWRDHDVVDPDGNKIGQLEAVYLDTADDVPVFASVKTGIGVVVLLADFVFLGARLRGRGRRPAR